jgi:Fe-S cluster assembly ATP-binding protein
MVNFLRQAVNAVRGQEIPIREFRELLFSKMETLKVDTEFARRYVNDGFSGGEKKRAEMLQMAMLQPAMAVLDETDSGLDIDALRTVAEGVNALMNPEMGLLLITHYQRLLNYIKPQFVHVLIDGRIVRSGGPELAEELEITGYDEMEAALAASAQA